jgi:hypothetical protein
MTLDWTAVEFYTHNLGTVNEEEYLYWGLQKLNLHQHFIGEEFKSRLNSENANATIQFRIFVFPFPLQQLTG